MNYRQKHLIIGPNRECMCGLYRGHGQTCEEIMQAAAVLASDVLDEPQRRSTAQWLHETLLAFQQGEFIPDKP